jgi:hypothetical protein
MLSGANADFEEADLLGTIKGTFDADEDINLSTTATTQGSAKKCFLIFCSGGSSGATAYGKITGDASVSAETAIDFSDLLRFSVPVGFMLFSESFYQFSNQMNWG